MNFNRLPNVAAITTFVLLLANTALGLSPQKNIAQYLHRRWEVDDGIPQSEVTALVQEPSGYLVFGTQEGLVRFDGVQFEVFDKLSTPELVDNHVTALWLDADENLWIGTELSLVRRTGTSFKTISNGTPLEDRTITAITADQDGGLWVGTRSSGLFYGQNDQFIPFAADERLQGAAIQHLMTDRRGSVWVSSHNGLFRIRKKKVDHFGTESGLPDIRVNVAYQHRGRHLWVGTDDGLCRFDGRRCTADPRNAQLTDKRIRTILRDKHRTLWIGTFTGGLVALRKNKALVADDIVGINREINKIIEDHEGSLWIGTGINGLHQLYDGKVSNYRFDLSPTSDAVMTMLVDNDGVLWAGMENGLVRYDNDVAEYITKKDGLQNEYVVALAEARDGGLWVGTNGGGFAHYKKGVFRFLDENDGLADGQIRALYEAPDGTLWVGTKRGGLHLFKNDQLTAHYNAENGLNSNRVIAIVPDTNSDSLLLATGSGVLRYANGQFDDLFAKLGIPAAMTLAIYKDTQGRLFVGTAGAGLYIIDRNKVHQIDAAAGLADDNVFAILPDASGNLWMSSNKGIFKVPKSDILGVIRGTLTHVQPTTFDTSDGMLSRECNAGSTPTGWKTPSGQMWFASVGGAVLVEPGNIFTNKIRPPVSINQLIVDRKAYSNGVILDSSSERLEFRFSALSFIAPERNSYIYQLEGYDDKWLEAGTERYAHYTKIPPKRYRFLVKARNNDGVWSREPAVFSFEIEPKFYQTAWFRTTAGVLFVILLLGFLVWRDRRMRSHNAQLASLAWEQTSKILQSQVDRIHNLTRTAQAVSKETEHSMSQLARSAEGVSRAINETSVRVSDINQGGLEAEDNAQQIGAAVKETQQEFAEGNRAAQQSSEIIMQIRSDSMEIVEKISDLQHGIAEAGRILTIVKEIADKSKILSVNASIEASKAGTAGKGFNLVAHKMRQLAHSSHNSAKEIGTLLSTLEQSVVEIDQTAKLAKDRTVEGSQRISASGDAINNLTHKMAQNQLLADDITTTVDGQLVGLNHISTAIAQIKSNSDNNMQISQEVEAGAKELYHSIDELLDAVGSWETPDFYRTQIEETKPHGSTRLSFFRKRS